MSQPRPHTVPTPTRAIVTDLPRRRDGCPAWTPAPGIGARGNACSGKHGDGADWRSCPGRERERATRSAGRRGRAAGRGWSGLRRLSTSSASRPSNAMFASITAWANPGSDRDCRTGMPWSPSAATSRVYTSTAVPHGVGEHFRANRGPDHRDRHCTIHVARPTTTPVRPPSHR
jgi:hypothetical protein